MSAKEDILRALRSRAIGQRPYPSAELKAVQFRQPLANLTETFKGVGVELITVAEGELASTMSAHPMFAHEQGRVCWAHGEALFKKSGWKEIGDASIAEWNILDVAVLKAECVVAENGAMWVTEGEIPRATWFLAARMAIVVHERDLVHNLHEAYAKISTPQGFGCFISGPSKTADVGQTLVVGAHGPTTLTVFMVRSAT